MRWEQGRATVEQLLADKELQRVPPSRAHADRLLGQAANHILTARAAAAADPEGAYGLVYDAARKALTAILANQGLRPTSRGGHIAVYQAVRAQLDPPMGRTVQPFDRMRRRRKDAEYPDLDAPELGAEDVADDLPKVEAILSMALQVLDTMSPFLGRAPRRSSTGVFCTRVRLAGPAVDGGRLGQATLPAWAGHENRSAPLLFPVLLPAG